MATQEQIQNTRVIMAQIWDASILTSIRMNDDVVEVVGLAFDAVMKKSEAMYKIVQAVVEGALGGAGIASHFGKGTIARTFGRTIFTSWPPLTEPFTAALVSVAAQYRTPLMMASNGLGVWV